MLNLKNVDTFGMKSDAATKVTQRSRRIAQLFAAFAFLTLAAGSVLCASAWFPHNLNETVGPGTATYIALELWPLVLGATLLFATIALRVTRQTRFALRLAAAGVLSWLVILAMGDGAAPTVIVYFFALNVGAAACAWRFVARMGQDGARG